MANGRDGTFPSALLTLVAAAVVIAFVDVAIAPFVLREGATDWRAYEHAGQLFQAHQDPYAWVNSADPRALFPYQYLYPPPLAAIWTLGLNASFWLALKVVSLGSLALFAVPAVRAESINPRGSRLARAGLAVVLFALALAFVPVIHDLVLGNVMVLYLAAFAVLAAAPGRRWGAIPLGVLVAIAFKPFVVPVVFWLLIRHRAQFGAFVLSALAVTALFVVLVGQTAYVEYLSALPRMGSMAQPFSGNTGLASISVPLALAAIPLALVWSAGAAYCLSATAGLSAAMALTLLVQPALGLNYGSVLIPAVILLWRIDRPAGLAMAVIVPLLVVISPPLAGLAIAVTATVVGYRRKARGVEQADGAMPA